MRKTITFLLCVISLNVFANVDNPVHWKFATKKISQGKYAISLIASIDDGWHIYSQFIKSGGPVATSFKFDPISGLSFIDKVTEQPEPISHFDPSFQMTVRFFEHQALFAQLIEVTKPMKHISGSLEYMVCNDQKCLPPNDINFAIPISTEIMTFAASSNTKKVAQKPQAKVTLVLTTPVKESASLLTILIEGFLSGLAAFFLPCFYPMVPLTVSFFTKREGTRIRAIKSAMIYGLSIIAIYVILGLAVTALFGSSALNEAASSATFNLLFFVVLIAFALSFLGAFEITIPSSIVNKADQKSESGGWTGLFFMAFTLALVSFSCTGPLVGTLLVDAVSKGSFLGPALGMLGFSFALALPFTAFAIFPSWLKALPKSGGWLNTLKVVLGLLELALAFKYLSNVDLAYHWNLLNRDLFLMIWIIIFGVLGFYLLGKIRLNNDAEVTRLPVSRLLLAMSALVFTLYLVPGLFGAPLKSISGWLPPQTNAQSFKTGSQASPLQTKNISHHKYTGLFHAPNNIDAFYDYDEGLAYAKVVNKPILLDFTGWSCTNCRKMEASVWSDPEILKKLKEDYVLISLYVDDRTALSDSEKYLSKFSGKSIKTLGQKWRDLQESHYNTNAQPFYVVLTPKGQLAAPPRAFDLDINAYLNFLDKGIDLTKETSKI